MVIVLPALRIGEPLRYKSLSVFPLFGDTSPGLDYRLADEAIADQQVVVEEVSEGGSVPDLKVENQGESRVLFIEGQELVGAKQNRVLNTTLLVAAQTALKIPVSCVERGRWAYTSRRFGSSGSHATPRLRRTLKASVSSSLKAKQGYRSDQGEVWKGIDEMLATYRVDSSTAAMADAYQAYQDQIATIREKLGYVAGANGLAIAIGPRIISLDYFDQPATCRKVWDRLISGFVLEALEAGSSQQVASADDVESLIEGTRGAEWSTSAAIGVGEDWRAETLAGDHASALQVDSVVVHASVVTAG